MWIKKHTTKERIVELEDRTEEITWIASWRHKEWKIIGREVKRHGGQNEKV